MSLNDLSLTCSECKKHYTSAALLLQHYAQHIIFSYSDAAKSIRAERKRKRKEKSAEDENKDGRMESDNVSSPNSSSDSSTGPRFMSSTNSEDGEFLRQEQNNNVEINENYLSGISRNEPLNLVKIDLQQCLDNEVSPESSIKIKTEANDALPIKIKSEVLIKEEFISDDELNAEPNIAEIEEKLFQSRESSEKSEDEFNPLKYCMITMEDENGANKLNAEATSEKKFLVSAEQQVNHVPLNYRKLAPKPSKSSKLTNPEKRVKHVKKYPCHLCDKIFGWSTDLKRHVLIHTGERPFKCQVCLASFTRNFLLQKHQSKIHPCSKPSNAFNNTNPSVLFKMDMPPVLKA